MMQEFTQDLADEAATLAFGALLSQHIQAGQTLYLHGDLGAGKTTLVRGVLHGLGYAGKVKSPTYTLVEPYSIADKSIYHFDLYRFNDAEEWESAGFREYFNPRSICFVEWSENVETLIPQADIDLFIVPKSTGRHLTIRANSASGTQFLQRLST